MFSIGIADCLQQISHIYAGLITLTANNFSFTLEKFMGGLGNAAWLAMIPQTLVLALNRYNVFRKQNSSSYFGTFQFMLFCCWIFGGAFFVTYMSSNTGILYDMYNFYWAYDHGSWSDIVSLIEYYSSVPLLIMAFIVYIGVVINITSMVSL
uniref:7TM GPCR serpentine receptor class x (Srx) domain-containing protein n=1 Tax=Panagrolaimus davidi TaxID=227884 RepID=A0A914PU29_9BILA